MTLPRIGVIVSHYQRPDGLRRALRSIREQTIAGELDVVVCDDASRSDLFPWDDVADWHRVHVLRGPRYSPRAKASQVLTMSSLINQATQIVAAPLIAYLTDDAEWAPDHLERLRYTICDYGRGAVAVGSRVRTLSYAFEGQEGPKVSEQPAHPDGPMRTQEFRSMLDASKVFDHSAVLHWRRYLHRDWPVEPTYWSCPDWEAWRRMCRHARDAGETHWLFDQAIDVTVHDCPGDIGRSLTYGDSRMQIFERLEKGP